jgi:hypothetical protein
MVKRDKKLSLFFYPDIYSKLYSMIKQTWEISNEERKRILSLHESATKNLYLMSEQDDVVQGFGNPSSLYDQDENYRYIASQPSYSVGSGYVDWKQVYFVYAINNEGTSFQCKHRKNEEGQPIDIEVLKDKPLPIFSKNPEINQFQLGLYKISKKEYRWDKGNELTQNALLGREMEGDLWTGGQYYGVFSAGWGMPETVVVMFEQSGRYKQNYNINFDELEVGSTTLFNPFNEGFYSKFFGKFSLFMPTLKSSYKIFNSPDEFNPKKIPPVEIPKITSFDIESPFEFDKTDLTPEAEKSFKEFIENIKKFYGNVSGDVTVTTSASIDSDPATKEQYNMELSKRRAQTIIDRLKKESGNTTLNFIPDPIGQTDKFKPGLKWPEVKDSNQTAPNRRLIIKLPEISQ